MSSPARPRTHEAPNVFRLHHLTVMLGALLYSVLRAQVWLLDPSYHLRPRRLLGVFGGATRNVPDRRTIRRKENPLGSLTCPSVAGGIFLFWKGLPASPEIARIFVRLRW